MPAGTEARGPQRLARVLLIWTVALVVACAPLRQTAKQPETPPVPRFENDRFISFDGAELGLTVWKGEGPRAGEIVVVGIHGMNDWANAFHMAAPWWAERGVTIYAYDQRGFGRSPGRGVWPEEELMREDLRTAVSVARQRHPGAVLAVVGISMGGAVAMTAFGSDDPPRGVDRLVLSGPGLRGWGALPLLYRPSLWLSARLRRAWIVRPPRFVEIWPSDNIEMLRRNGRDPMMQRENRIDQVEGVVSLMENAHDHADKLPPATLITYGAKDEVIPPAGMKRTAPRFPAHVRTAYYPDGYHMLLRDLQAEVVFADILAFLENENAALPSGVGHIPWALQTARSN
jgi:alpha-beta hydrolase superfamily lysophospholipase